MKMDCGKQTTYTYNEKIKRNLIEKKYLMNYEKWYNKEKIFFC